MMDVSQIDEEEASNGWAYRQWAILSTLLLCLIVGGTWFYKAQETQLKREVESNLTAIARLKAVQIAAWRRDQLEDATTLMQNPLVVHEVNHYLRQPEFDTTGDLFSLLTLIERQHDYTNIMLLNLDGELLFSLNGAPETPNHYAAALTSAVEENRPILMGLHTDPLHTSPHLAVVVPVFADTALVGQPVGGLILISDAADLLYPLINNWPVPSDSAETLLIRREGDEVLYLNDLRHQPDTALKLRVPMSQADLPAVMALEGQVGFVQGKDYRGVDVVAVLLPIADSPWYIVSKVDTDEAFATWQSRSLLILAVLFGLTTLIVVIGLVFWQRNQKAHYKAMYQAEADLRASMRRHDITLQAIGDGVIVTNDHGAVELLNPVAEVLTGWSNTSARGKQLSEVFHIVHEETREEAENPVTQALQKGVVVGLANHTLLLSRDGTERPIADSAAPILNEAGDITGVVLVFRDQTEDRHTQRLTQVRLELIAYAATHTLDEFLTKSLDEAGKFVNSPIGFYHFVGADRKMLSLQQWSTRTLQEFCQAGGKGSHYPIEQAGVWADCVRQKQPVIHNDYEALENKRGLPAGHARLIREVVVPVTRGDQIVAILGLGNKPTNYNEKDVEVISFFADVTWQIIEIKRAEEERELLLRQIQQQAQQLQKIMETVPEGIFLLDNEYKVIQANSTAQHSLADLARTSTGGSLTHLGDRELDGLLTSPPKGVWHELRSNNRFFEISARPIELAPSIHGWVVALREVTKQRQIIEQLQRQEKLAAVGKLAAGVAHDFNNLLAVIALHAQLLKVKLNLPPKEWERVTTIEQQTDRAVKLIQQILDFSRRSPMEKRPLDLLLVLKEEVKLLKRILPENIEIKLIVDAEDYMIQADLTRVQQIVMNLSVNARDAMPSGGDLIIKLSHLRIDKLGRAPLPNMEPGSWIHLSVTDNGTGIDPAIIDRIFDPFFTTKETGQGTGLGLAQVYGIVKQHDGFIDVTSKVNESTTFNIYLPEIVVEFDLATRSESKTIRHGRGECLLIVEDEPALREALADTLKLWQFKVLTAADGEAALSILRKSGEEIDLIISDMIMPRMGGLSFVHALRQQGMNTPVIMMSGHMLDFDRVSLKEYNIFTFLSKPLHPDRLSQALVEVLDGQKS